MNSTRNNNRRNNKNTVKNKNTRKNSNKDIKENCIREIRLLKDRIETLVDEIKEDKKKAFLLYKQDDKKNAFIQMNIYKVKESEVARINIMIENLRNIVKAILIAEKKVMKGGNPFIQNIKRKLKLPNSSTIEEVADKFMKKIQEEFKKMKNLTESEEKKNYKNLSDNNIKDLELELDLLELERL